MNEHPSIELTCSSVSRCSEPEWRAGKTVTRETSQEKMQTGIELPPKLEFSQESHAGKKKSLGPGVSQSRSLSPRKRLHTVLMTCQGE